MDEYLVGASAPGVMLPGYLSMEGRDTMKGIIFNLLEGVVADELGEDAWERFIDDSGVDGAYTSLGTYDSVELHDLAASIGPELGLSGDETVRWFGRRALGKLAGHYPGLFDGHARTIPFLTTLNDIIHPEVRKLYPGAHVPVFDYRSIDEDRLVMGYRSKRGLCWFGHGLIEGAGDHFGEQPDVAQTSCTKRGDSECVFEVVMH